MTEETKQLFEGSEILNTEGVPYTLRVLILMAQATHEANRAWCLINGDETQVSWETAPDWQKLSALKGVIGVLQGNTPEQSHESWLKEKAATGWKYGPTKDPELKEHPCFVPYADLPEVHKVKDDIFVSTVKVLDQSLRKVSELK